MACPPRLEDVEPPGRSCRIVTSWAHLVTRPRALIRSVTQFALKRRLECLLTADNVGL
jgi:hypothetical protein